MTENKSNVQRAAEAKAAEPKTTEKKTAAKKTGTKKSAAKRAPAKKKAATPDVKEEKTERRLSVKQVASRLLDGSQQWGTGRERDNALQAEGYNLNEVRTAVEDARRERLTSS